MDHLINNDPAGNSTALDPNPADDAVEHAHGKIAVGSYMGWRGPYLDKVETAPWGNRYAINSFALYSPVATPGGSDQIYSSGVVVLNAGPNGRIDTCFNQPARSGVYVAQGWEFGIDDGGCVLSAGGPF